MFIKEVKEINNYERSSKYGKLVKYSRTKYILHWTCDLCSVEFTRCKNGPYNKNSKSFCRECLKEHGVAKLAGMVGYESITKRIENNVGITYVRDKDEYPYVYVGKNYPYSNRTSLREHIFVMQEHLERKLEKGEIVHHIDGDKLNNKLDNLFLTTVDEHNKLHAASENIIFDLVKKGLVVFDRETARYKLTI